MNVEPYLYFNGRCEEALAFYEKSLGAKVGMKLRFDESPVPPSMPDMPRDYGKKIMHATFTVGDTTLHASDGHCAGAPDFRGFSLTLNVATPAEADKLFAVLVEGGQTRMPMGETFFAPRFGMVVDRFGLLWTIIARKEK